MDNSLRVRVRFHICHKIMDYYFDNTEFTSFDKFCEYIHGFISNDYYAYKMPKHVKKIIFEVADNVNVIFGFKQSEMVGLVLEFLGEKLWCEYFSIVFPMKKIYDSAF